MVGLLALMGDIRETETSESKEKKPGGASESGLQSWDSNGLFGA